MDTTINCLLMLVVSMVTRCHLSSAQRKTITIGGVFEHDHEAELRVAIPRMVDAINARRDLLPPGVHLVFDVEFFPAHDSFAATRIVCRQLMDGVAAVFGPFRASTSDHVQSVCDAVNIPHIRTHWDVGFDSAGHLHDDLPLHEDHPLSQTLNPSISSLPEITSARAASVTAKATPSGDDPSSNVYSVNIFPPYGNVSRALVDYVMCQDWSSFTVLYDSDDGLLRLQRLLRSADTRSNSVRITMRHLDSNPSGSSDFRSTLKEIRNRGESQILLDCDWRSVRTILEQAKSINMTTPYYHYVLTTLDSHLIDLDVFKRTGVNITAFSVLPLRGVPSTKTMATATGNTSTNAALLYDALHVFAAAMTELYRIRPVHTSSLSCAKPRSSENGASLLAYLKKVEFDGITGRVQFDSSGRRSALSLDLVEFSHNGLEKIGSWNHQRGLNITKKYSDAMGEIGDILKDKMLIVTTLLEEPYVMLKKDSNGNPLSNDSFEGFCVDLLDEISKILVFNYTLRVVEDGRYGAQVGPKSEWNGMVRELMDKRADLAVAALTISYIREQYIDFTKPFMNLGISILFKKPEKKNPGLFSFLSPLSFEIWIYMMAAYLVVSFMMAAYLVVSFMMAAYLVVSFSLFVLARFSPYEWYNPHPCNPDCDVVENQFTLINSLWFCVGSLMQQGSEVAPRALSTRLVSGIWWFFTLILISSYTANLAAFLTVERMKSPIESAEDLARQNVIKYGAIDGGSTMTFFSTSKIESYEKMWKAMQDFTPSAFVNSTSEGIERIRQGQYAMLLESRMIEYITQRSCDLMQVGGLLDSKGYGIGTPRGSPYRDLISDAILKLQEDQMLQMLYDKWWKEYDGAGHCDATAADDKGRGKDANALAIDNVGGVFVVLAVGLALSPFVAAFEFVWKSRRRRDGDCSWSPSICAVDNGSTPGQSVCSEMCAALNFAVHCSDSTSTKVKVHRPSRALSGRRLPVPMSVVDGGGGGMPSLTYRRQPQSRQVHPPPVNAPNSMSFMTSAASRTNGEQDRYAFFAESYRT